MTSDQHVRKSALRLCCAGKTAISQPFRAGLYSLWRLKTGRGTPARIKRGATVRAQDVLPCETSVDCTARMFYALSVDPWLDPYVRLGLAVDAVSLRRSTQSPRSVEHNGTEWYTIVVGGARSLVTARGPVPRQRPRVFYTLESGTPTYCDSDPTETQLFVQNRF
jgi:hypothetical protein